MIIAGIDPGQTGAIAFYDTDEQRVLEVFDMPTMARLHGKGQEVNSGELSSILRDYWPARVHLEAVSAMPKQGVSSTFRFAEGFGAIKGVLGALVIPYFLYTPHKWKQGHGLSKKDKDAARTLAINRHPEIADQLSRKKDCGRADAILLATVK